MITHIFNYPLLYIHSILMNWPREISRITKLPKKKLISDYLLTIIIYTCHVNLLLIFDLFKKIINSVF